MLTSVILTLSCKIEASFIASGIADGELLPQQFTQKIVIENWTATWCGYCPDGTYVLDELMEGYPNQVYGVAHHRMDDLTVTGSIVAVPSE